MLQLLLHLWGDYLTQSNWMATEKVKRSWPALCHVFLYSMPFLFIGSPLAVAVIMSTHFFIDRFRLVRYLIFIKNGLLSPIGEIVDWDDCKATGYSSDTPAWLAVGLMIVADNTIHLTINYAALRWL